jgi:hypothetical protein
MQATMDDHLMLLCYGRVGLRRFCVRGTQVGTSIALGKVLQIIKVQFPGK